MLGANDLRVPTKQGHELRKALQARGVPVKYVNQTISSNKHLLYTNIFHHFILNIAIYHVELLSF